ncbi:MAG: hypothetical protein CVT73_04870 [Alphaproteobacteria bacterium HGW-Alphaproteobacteria-12]|nr:MAG: hypothetical protein CVT73_04870 [Alphaproteobacteria bacterium HGW-Alphaproteobacteria-12]
MSGAKQQLALSLSNIFENLANLQDGEAVTLEDGARLLDILDQPITSCIDYICGLPIAQSPEDLGQKLAAASIKALFPREERPGA